MGLTRPAIQSALCGEDALGPALLDHLCEDGRQLEDVTAELLRVHLRVLGAV